MATPTLARPRVIIYARNSSENATDTNSMEGQVARCERYAADYGWEVVGKYVEFKSGRKLERAKFAAALAQGKAVEAAILLVPEIGRFSRSLAQFPILKERLVRSGMQLWAADSGEIRTATASDKLTTNMRVLVEEFYADQMQEKVAEGRRNIVEGHGRMLAGPKPLYGLHFGDLF